MQENRELVVLNKIEEIVQDTEVAPPVEPELLTGRALAQAFIQDRLRNASSIESAKSKAVGLLLEKIDENTRPEQLVKIIELLDSCTAKDMEHIAAMSQNDKTRELLAGIMATAEQTKSDVADVADQSLKALHNIFHVLKVMKSESGKSESRTNT